MSATGAGERSEAGAARGRGCGTRPSRQGGRRRAAPRREATGLGGAQGRGDGREVTGPDSGTGRRGPMWQDLRSQHTLRTTVRHCFDSYCFRPALRPEAPSPAKARCGV